MTTEAPFKASDRVVARRQAARAAAAAKAAPPSPLPLFELPAAPPRSLELLHRWETALEQKDSLGAATALAELTVLAQRPERWQLRGGPAESEPGCSPRAGITQEPANAT
jgi:hypothetical protein